MKERAFHFDSSAGCLRGFSFRLAAMLRILPRFGKIGVRIFQHRILIAMS